MEQEYVQGRGADKDRLDNGNLGLIVEDTATRRRKGHRECGRIKSFRLRDEKTPPPVLEKWGCISLPIPWAPF